MVVMSGAAMSAGSSFKRFAARGSVQPIDFDSMTVPIIANDTVRATFIPRANTSV